MLGFPLHDWENVMVVFLICAGFFALLSGAATYVVVKLQRIELTESRDRIAANEIETSEAKVALANANVEINRAQAQAAALQKEAADARVEQERLKALVYWRTFTTSQQDKFESTLKESPIDRKVDIIVAYAAGDTEAQYLAILIANTLGSVGYQISLQSRTYSSGVFFGIYVSGKAELVNVLREAFAAAQLPASPNTIPGGFSRL